MASKKRALPESTKERATSDQAGSDVRNSGTCAIDAGPLKKPRLDDIAQALDQIASQVSNLRAYIERINAGIETNV
jgi:hypothetical protein